MSISTFIRDTYGVNPIYANVNTVAWAAHRVKEQLGLVEATRQLEKLNKARVKRGSRPCFVDEAFV